MSMFSYKEFKHALFVFLLFFVGLVAILIPLNQLLPDFFDPMIPDFLENKSVWYYVINEHLNFFLELIVVVGLVAIILFLWRKR